MRRGVGGAIPAENVVRLLPAFHRIVGVGAVVSSKNVFPAVPHFTDRPAGVREELAAVEGIPLAAGEHHDGDVLIQSIGLPLRMPKNNYWTARRHRCG